MPSFTIELPEPLAVAAQQAGLLNSQTLAGVLRELVRERAARSFAQALQALDAQPVSATELTPADIWQAIDAARRH